jgi:hypothetical protein
MIEAAVLAENKKVALQPAGNGTIYVLDLVAFTQAPKGQPRKIRRIQRLEGMAAATSPEIKAEGQGAVGGSAKRKTDVVDVAAAQVEIGRNDCSSALPFNLSQIY